MTVRKSHSSIWSLPFVIMMSVNLFNSAGQYMIGAALPKYANHLGASPVLVGLVSSVFSIAALLIRPVTGSALDYFKKKTLLCISLSLTALMYFTCAISSDVKLLIAARFVDGIGASVKVPLCLALATEFLPEDKVGSGIGVYSLAQAIASALGPGISLGMIELWGYRPSLLFIVFIALITLGLMLTLKGEHYIRPAEPFRIRLSNIYAPEAVFPAIIILTLAMPYSATMAYLPIMGELYHITDIGIYYTVYSIALFIARPLCGKLLDKVKFTRIIIPSLASYALAMLLMSRSTTLAGFLISAIFAALGYGVAHPCLQSLCMKWVSKEKRGAGGNTYYIGVDIGHFTGALLTGQLVTGLMTANTEASAYSKAFAFQVIPIGISACVALYAGYRRSLKEHGQEEKHFA